MEEKILLAELKKNCNGKKEKVLELLKTFDLAELGREVWNERFKDITNRVLSENEFFAESECNREPYHIKVGDRITDESFTFLLSEEDFDRLQELARPIEVAENLTDENGYFIENWDTIVCNARCELVEYIIKEILPSALRGIFWEFRSHILYQEKLIKITKSAFLGKAA